MPGPAPSRPPARTSRIGTAPGGLPGEDVSPAQQELRGPVLRRDEVAADVVTTSHEVAGGFFFDGGDAHRRVFADGGDAGEELGVAFIGLDLVAGRADEF